MSAYLYDEAVVNNLRQIVGDNRIQILPVDRVYDIIPRIDDDKLTLPLISLTRTGWEILSDDANHSSKFEGATSRIIYNDKKFNETRIQKFQFVPMRIDYSLDVWTRTRRENDEFIRELYWYYMMSPTLQITVPYDLDFDHNFNLFVARQIEDNSDIAQHTIKGEIFRQTISLYTDDAKLWKSTSRAPTTVDIHFEIRPQTVHEAAINYDVSDNDDQD